MDKTEERQELYRQVQEMQYQIQSMEKHLDEITVKLDEAKNLRLSLGEFEKVKEGDEFLAPLSNGIFVRAKLLSADDLKVNVGSGVLVRKTLKETQKLIDNQIIELKKIKEKSDKEYDKILARAQELTQEVGDNV